jgi:zinc transport system substrate-binding protein
LIVGAAAVLALTACGRSSEAHSGTTIVATFYPLAFIAQQVVPSAHVTNVTPAGAEPHDLELTPRDVEPLSSAGLVIYLGGGFQPALEDALEGNQSALDLLEAIELGADSDEREDEFARDPHVWLDPLRFAAMAKVVAEASGDPAAADGLIADLKTLDGEFRDGLAECERNVLVTSHAAFGYLADAYGLEQIALAGLSPEAEPSPRDLQRLVEGVKQAGATTVFFETLVSPAVAETVAREAGATTAVLNPLEGLTEEELERGADYFSVMRENLQALRQALGCT